MYKEDSVFETKSDNIQWILLVLHIGLLLRALILACIMFLDYDTVNIFVLFCKREDYFIEELCDFFAILESDPILEVLFYQYLLTILLFWGMQ